MVCYVHPYQSTDLVFVAGREETAAKEEVLNATAIAAVWLASEKALQEKLEETLPEAVGVGGAAHHCSVDPC